MPGAKKARKSAAKVAKGSKKNRKSVSKKTTKKATKVSQSKKLAKKVATKKASPTKNAKLKDTKKVVAKKVAKKAKVAKSVGKKPSTEVNPLAKQSASKKLAEEGLGKAAPAPEKTGSTAPTVQVAESPRKSKPPKTKKKMTKSEIKALEELGKLGQKWALLHDKMKGDRPAPYKMSGNYEARSALMHKVLGWGYVLSSQNNRLEVLFKDGIKVLISNYRS